jgi:hypothetical protein
MSLQSFINKFGGMTEEYTFYGGTVTLRYDPKDHQYLLVTPGGLEPQDGVTSICHIIDRSDALIPWACKQMAAKLLTDAPIMTLPTGERVIRQMDYQEYENLVLAGKTAHKDKLEEAGDIGHIAHAWIERYIKAVLANDQARQEELLAKFPEDERATNCCLAALDWMRDHNVRWITTERKIYSRRYGYAGTLDGLCIVDSCDNPKCRGCAGRPAYKDRLTISDWKTSNYLYIEYLLQTAAYMQAYNEETEFVHGQDDKQLEWTERIVTDRWIIRLGKEDAEFDPWYADASTYDLDWKGFHTALVLSRTVESIKLRVKERTDYLRAQEKAEKQRLREEAEAAEKARKVKEKADKKTAREAALKVKCPKADKYKGTRYPKCNGGDPCQTCLAKYRTNHPATLGDGTICEEASVPSTPRYEPFNESGTMCPPSPEMVDKVVELEPSAAGAVLALGAPKSTLLLEAPKG